MAASGAAFGAAQGFGSAFPGLMQYFFGNSGAPSKGAGDEYSHYYNQGRGYQNPFYNAGTNAIGGYQDWLNGMKDPSAFINNLMGQYKESPFAHYQQQQGVRAAQNIGSASGLSGSTPLAMQAQQNAQNISSQDMQTWLQNVLGINSQYGAGLDSLMGRGQHAGDVLSQMAGNAGEYMGGARFGQQAGEQYDRNALFGALGKLFGG